MTTTRKLRSEHTIADILRIKPKWFMEKQTDKEQALANLNYIHTLLEYGLGHMANESFHDVFDGYHIDMPTEHRGIINKYLIEFKREYKRTKPIHANVLAPRLTRFGLIDKDSLRDALKPNTYEIQEELRQITNDIQRFPHDIEEYQKTINEYRGYIEEAMKRGKVARAKQRALQLLLEEDSATIDPHKKRLLQAIPDEWMVVRVDASQFWLVRKKPIILNYIGTAESGMAKSLHMGYFLVWFDWNLRCKGSKQLADYISTGASSSIHPHLSGNSICWGNQAHKAERYIDTKDYKAFFELFESILTTYCPDNPYVSFDTIERRRTNHYTAISDTNFTSWGWLLEKKNVILDTIAETASDRFLEAYAKMPRNHGQITNISQKRTGLITYFAKIQTKMKDNYEKLKGILDEHGPLEGEAIIRALKSVGIHLPDREVFLRCGMQNPISDLSHNILAIMACVYKTIPYRVWDTAHSKWIYRNLVSYNSVYKTMWSGIKLNSYGNTVLVYDIFTDPEKEPTIKSQVNIPSITYELMYREDIEKLPARYREHILLDRLPTRETPEVVIDEDEEVVEDRSHWYNDDYEHGWQYCDDNGHDFDDGVCARCDYQCEHDDHDSSGHCTYCGVYDADYDES